MFESESEEWVKENMDCVKTEGLLIHDCNYFSDEERCVAKSAYQDGAEFGYNKAIEELEEEIAELKEHQKRVCGNLTNTHRNIREQLTKARDLILNLYNAGRDVLMCRNEELAYTRLDNAINDKRIEQFLKEIK